MATKIKDALFIGDGESSQDPEFLELNKITYIINCAGRQLPNLWEPHGLRYLTFPWDDTVDCMLFDPNNLVVMQIYSFIEEGLAESESVLIHSLEGISRCCACVVPYLMYKYHWGFEKTFEFVCSKRPDLAPNPGFMQQLFLLDKRLQQKWLKESAASEDFTRRRLFEWDYAAPPSLTAEDGHQSENDEQLLINSYTNSQPQITSIPEPALPIVDKTNMKLRWIDQVQQAGRGHPSPSRRGAANQAAQISPNSPALHRPPNNSYNSLSLGPGWVDSFQPASRPQRARPSSAKKRPLKSILKHSNRHNKEKMDQPAPQAPLHKGVNRRSSKDLSSDQSSTCNSPVSSDREVVSEQLQRRLSRQRSSGSLPDPKGEESKRNELYDFLGLKASGKVKDINNTQRQVDDGKASIEEYSMGESLNNRTEMTPASSSSVLEPAQKKGSVESDLTPGEEESHDSNSDIERLVRKFSSGVTMPDPVSRQKLERDGMGARQPPSQNQEVRGRGESGVSSVSFNSVRVGGFRDSMSSSQDKLEGSGQVDPLNRSSSNRSLETTQPPPSIHSVGSADPRSSRDQVAAMRPSQQQQQNVGRTGQSFGSAGREAWSSNNTGESRRRVERPGSAGSNSVEVEPQGYSGPPRRAVGGAVGSSNPSGHGREREPDREEYRRPASAQTRQHSINNYLDKQQQSYSSTLPKNINASMTTQDHLLQSSTEGLLQRPQTSAGQHRMSSFQMGGPIKATAAVFTSRGGPGGNQQSRSQQQQQRQQWAQPSSSNQQPPKQQQRPSSASRRQQEQGGGDPSYSTYPGLNKNWANPVSGNASNGSARSLNSKNPQDSDPPRRGRRATPERSRPNSAPGGGSRERQADSRGRSRYSANNNGGASNSTSGGGRNSGPQVGPAPRRGNAPPVYRYGSPAPRARTGGRKQNSVNGTPTFGRPTVTAANRQQPRRDPSPGAAARSRSASSGAGGSSSRFSNLGSDPPVMNRRGRSASPAPREKVSGAPTNRRRSPSPASQAFRSMSGSSQRPRWR